MFPSVDPYIVTIMKVKHEQELIILKQLAKDKIDKSNKLSNDYVNELNAKIDEIRNIYCEQTELIKQNNQTTETLINEHNNEIQEIDKQNDQIKSLQDILAGENKMIVDHLNVVDREYKAVIGEIITRIKLLEN